MIHKVPKTLGRGRGEQIWNMWLGNDVVVLLVGRAYGVRCWSVEWETYQQAWPYEPCKGRGTYTPGTPGSSCVSICKVCE